VRCGSGAQPEIGPDDTVFHCSYSYGSALDDRIDLSFGVTGSRSRDDAPRRADIAA
jgi:hypothetical protein